jgi:hypothetical protein
MLLAFAGYGAASSADYAATSRQFGVAASPADQRLLAALQAHGITRFLASYWICYRLVFESGEQAVCADHEAEGALFATRPGYNRYWPYVILLRQTSYPAYIFLAGSPEDTGFVSDAAAYGWPHAGYVRFSVAGYAVYYRPTGSD